MTSPVFSQSASSFGVLFAQLKELAKTNSIRLDIVQGDCVSDLLTKLESQYGELCTALRDKTAMVSINQQIAQWDSLLNDGDEVGFLPPVSGG